MTLSYQNFLGIDIGKFELVVAIHQHKEIARFDNNSKGWHLLYKQFSDILPFSLVVLETTGGYESGLLYFLVGKGLAVHRANTRKVKNFILSHGTLAKTDNLDARALALYGFERHNQLELYVPASKDEAALLQLSSHCIDLKYILVAEKNRAQAPTVSSMIKKSHQKLIDLLESELKKMRKSIQKVIDKNPKLKEKQAILETIPGIGIKTSQDLICLMPELGSLNRRQVASLAGVAPHPKESGKTIGYRRIHGGRQDVRNALFMAAMAARNSNSDLATFYHRLVRNGKKPIVAITALMRKIIVIANAKLKDYYLNLQHS